jgi:hypothetical protein
MFATLNKIQSTIANALVSEPKEIEIAEARVNLFMAYHNFENAEVEYVDAAIENLNAAERQYGLVLAKHTESINDGIFDADNNIICRGMLRLITVGKVQDLYEHQPKSVCLNAAI